jgi:uncharacterized protein YndB with AHSA1/START domain
VKANSACPYLGVPARRESWSGEYFGKMAPGRDTVSAERVIRAPAAVIFDVIADPSRHVDFDGSGSVRRASQEAPARLFQGAVFVMEMKRSLPYGMANTVVEFEENRVIAWAPRFANGRAQKFFGRVWRYELEPAEDGTLVRETWDVSHDRLRIFLRLLFSAPFRRDMEESLRLLDGLVTTAI